MLAPDALLGGEHVLAVGDPQAAVEGALQGTVDLTTGGRFANTSVQDGLLDAGLGRPLGGQEPGELGGGYGGG